MRRKMKPAAGFKRPFGRFFPLSGASGFPEAVRGVPEPRALPPENSGVPLTKKDFSAPSEGNFRVFRRELGDPSAEPPARSAPGVPGGETPNARFLLYPGFTVNIPVARAGRDKRRLTALGDAASFRSRDFRRAAEYERPEAQSGLRS
jgi:hypothetical protein